MYIHVHTYTNGFTFYIFRYFVAYRGRCLSFKFYISFNAFIWIFGFSESCGKYGERGISVISLSLSANPLSKAYRPLNGFILECPAHVAAPILFYRAIKAAPRCKTSCCYGRNQITSQKTETRGREAQRELGSTLAHLYGDIYLLLHRAASLL